MAKNKASSKTQQENYKRYKAEGRHEKNKIRRLARHCQHNPNDEQAQAVLDKGVFAYNRNSFQHQKQVAGPVKLGTLAPDVRLTVTEQLKRLIDSGDLVIQR